MVYSEVPCVAAGTFTTNIVKAAPVKWDQEIVYNHPTAQVIICNSGIANACTGEEGYGYCRKTAESSSRCTLNVMTPYWLHLQVLSVYRFRSISIMAGVEMQWHRSLQDSGSWKSGKGNHDNRYKEKEVAVQIEIGGKTVTIGGMCKGSGMIHPNMCTMLGFVTTDANAFPKRFCRKH